MAGSQDSGLVLEEDLAEQACLRCAKFKKCISYLRNDVDWPSFMDQLGFR